MRTMQKMMISAVLVVAFVALFVPLQGFCQDASEEAAIENKVANLQSRFHADRESAVSSLSVSSGTALAKVENAAESAWIPGRICALRTLSIMAPEKTIQRLAEAANEKDITLRLGAAKIAEGLGIEGAKKLYPLLEKETDDKKAALRNIIASACDRQVKKMLSEIMNSPEGNGQFPGQYRKLTSIGSVIEPALSRIVEETSSGYGEAAAASLAELGDKAAIPALRKAYLDNNLELKLIAAATLHILGANEEYKEIEKLLTDNCGKGNSYDYTQLALFYDRAREYGKGTEILKLQIARFGGSPQDHINLACFLSVQNKVEEAFAEFVKGVEKGYSNMEWVKIDGELANLRNTKQFQSFVRTKFPEEFKDVKESEKDKENE